MATKLLGKTISLIPITLFLVVCNLLVIQFFDIQASRWARLTSFIILFVLFGIQKKHIHPLLVTVLIFLFLRDIAVLFYEKPLLKTLAFVGSIGAYVTSIFFVMGRLNFSELTAKVWLFILAMVGINIFNVYYLSDVIIPSLDNSIQLVLFFTQSAVILFLALFAYLYFEYFEGKHPMQYLFFAFAFIMADLCGLVAYFFGVEPAYFLERTFYILGLALLINFARNYRSEKLQLNTLRSATFSDASEDSSEQKSAVEAQYFEKRWFI
ncbi:MAG: hypothetical protein R3359_11795 [Marinirhabdus sp.]|nr:hypothetical protein [Marinirhabdus sp.]